MTGRDPRGGWGEDPAGTWGADAADLVALAETDALLDRLAARRPTAADLDDSAAAVLALLAADVDVAPAGPDRLRRELEARGVWPPAAAPAPDLTLLPSVPGRAPKGGPAWASGRPAVAAVPHRTGAVVPPRRVRLRGLAVAASAAVVLYGAGAAATGSWAPWSPSAGTSDQLAGPGDAEKLRAVLTAGLASARDDDVKGAERRLRQAAGMLDEADLTPGQQAQVEQLIAQLAKALEDQGVAVEAGVLPADLPAPVATDLPGGVTTDEPTTGDDPVAPSPAASDPGRGSARPTDAGPPTSPAPGQSTTDPAGVPTSEPAAPTTDPGGQTDEPGKKTPPGKTKKPTDKGTGKP